MISLTSRTILVTGHTRGIGKACAELCAAAGASVLGWSRSTHGDLSDAAVVERLAAGVATLDHLVINHGIWPVRPVALADMAPAQWHETMAVNLHAVFHLVRALVPKLNDGGSVVLIASTAGQRGEAFHADYAASKGAIISLTKSLAVELAPRLRVNCVAPGWVDTDMAAEAFEGGARASIEAGIPLRRVATAADVAGPVLFLCSPLARHVTGEILNVNGGSVLCG